MSASAGRVLLIHKGTYDNSATYNPMDEVFYDGSTYVCKATTTGNLPTNTTYWQIMAQKGADGGVPSGGTTGQVVTKASNTDYDVEWADTFSIEDARDAEVIPSKNLFYPNAIHNGTADGVTYTVNADGSISTSGTTTADTNILFGKVTLKAGTYVLSGSSISPTQYAYRLRLADANDSVVAWDDGEGGQFTVTTEQEYSLRLRYGNNVDLSGLTFYPMICTLAEWNKSHAYEPYYIPLKDAMFRREEQRVLGAKNLLRNVLKSQVINGITFTVDNDGIITANGTATADAILKTDYTIASLVEIIPVENCIVSCGNDEGYDGTVADVFIALYPSSSSLSDEVLTQFVGFSGKTISGHFSACRYGIKIYSGKTVNNLKFKPMIRLASDPDDTYVPYCMTNSELTANVGRKVSATVSGTSVTFTDSSLTASSIIDGPYVANTLTTLASVTEGTGTVTFTFSNSDADGKTAYIWIRG